MGTDVNEVVERIPSSLDFKVHRVMCTDLLKLVERIDKIFPDIEAARPRCSSGIQALVSLSNTKEKAKLLLQNCTESSKLYLALTGEAILSRCKNSRNLLDQSLSQIQNNVPVLLAAEISRIIADLRATTFTLDPTEEEVGQAVKKLRQQYASLQDSTEESKAIQFAASRLRLTSKKALLIEKRSIKKLLDKAGDNEKKKMILLFLIVILKKYEKSITKMQTENYTVCHEDSFSLSSDQTDSQIKKGDLLSRLPPDDFKCPLSLRLMYDPVVIDSGQTFERMWIQKWFDEGHYTCPQTKQKLTNLSLTPNTNMKDLITKWCTLYGVAVVDPYTQSNGPHSWENSSLSVASLSNSMKDLYIPVDLSSVSLGSLDTSYGSEDLSRTISSGNKIEREMKFLKNLDGLDWESRCKIVEDFFKNEEDYYRVVTPENFIEPLLRFLSDAVDLIDVKAQRSGCMLLLGFLRKCRSNVPNLQDDEYALLASFLGSEVKKEALEIMEIFSRFQRFKPKIAESGALTYIINMLETERRYFQETSIKLLYNLSSESEICSLIASSRLVPKLVPFLEDVDISRYNIHILSRLCEHKAAQISVIETEGCVASIVRILESDNCEDQEHAVSILLSLCSQSDKYCRMIMNEGVVPPLHNMSLKGNNRGKMFALELLRILREIEYDDVVEESPLPNNLDIQIENVDDQCREKKSISRGRGIFGKIPIFSKSSSKAPSKKK